LGGGNHIRSDKFKLIGTSAKRLDTPAKVNGTHA
jgi:hypothetical protein